jgi:FkbM family methyltransferase
MFNDRKAVVVSRREIWMMGLIVFLSLSVVYLAAGTPQKHTALNSDSTLNRVPMVTAAATPPPTPNRLPTATAEWASDVLHSTADISFKRQTHEDISFWVAMENSFHSVDFILQHEQANIGWWQDTIRAAKTKQGGRCRALDVGSNAGFFSLISRAMGCEVLAIDAQIRCLNRLQSASAVNGFTQGLDVRWGAVNNLPGTMEIDTTKCSGLWGVETPRADWITDNPNGVPGEEPKLVNVQMRTLSELMDGWLDGSDHIDVMKIDTEGHEWEVLKSALPFFKQKRIHSVMFEVKLERQVTSVADITMVLETFYDMGYECGSGRKPIGLSKSDMVTTMSGSRVSPADWFCFLKASAL